MLHDLPLDQIQPLRTADDKYISNAKSKVKKKRMMFWMKFQSNKIRLCEFKLGELSHETCSYVEIKCQLYARDDIYCRFYCLLNMFRAPLCPSSGAREYYTGGCCLWYLVLWFSSCRYVELLMMGIMVPETC